MSDTDDKENLEETFSMSWENGNTGPGQGSYQPGQVWNANPAPIGIPPNQIQQPFPGSLPPGSAWNNENPGWPQGKGVQLRYCNKLTGWQQMIATKLKEEDQCILAKPAVGKTMPVICYWANNLLRLNTALNPTATIRTDIIDNLLFTPKNLPQVLWLVPIRSLSENILQDVKEDFIEIILQIINQEIHSETGIGVDGVKFTSLQPRLIRFINNSNDLNSRSIANNTINQINYYLNQVAGTADPLLKKEIYSKIVDLDKSLYNSLAFIIRQHVENHLVGQKYENVSSWDDNNGNAKPFIIAIYESAKSIINRMDKLGLIIFDECQRLLLSGVNNKMEDDRAEQIMASLDSVLSNNNVKKARLVLLTGTTHPEAAKELTNFLNITYYRNFANTGPVIVPGSNAGDIKIIPRDGLDQFDKQVEIIRSKLAEIGPGSGSVLYIILNKKRIDMLLDKLSTGGNYGSVPTRNINVGGKKPYFDKSDAEFVLGPVSATNIKDPLLRRAVASGLGRIYRPYDNSLLPLDDARDNQIVQQLFLRGEIKVLLTTESVREGINVKAKTMYLSSIETNGEKISLGNLCQLINRVGRAPGYYSIYVATKDCQYVEQALNANPEDFQKESHIPNKSNKANLRYTVGTAQHNIINLIHGFQKLIS
jgi:hypothetical protein